MAARVTITEESIPRLPNGSVLRFDQARKQWVVLAPERLFVLDETAHDILNRCDGKATVAAIVDALAAAYAAPRNVILADVQAMLQDFADKGVMTA